MEILINFMERDNWSVHCVTADARTEISPFMSIKKKETLLRLLRYVGAGDVQIAEVELNLRLWARGCCSHPARARAQESAQAPQALERWSRIASSCHVRPLRSIHRHRGDLVSLNSNGEQAQAEQVLRVLADAPAPGKCPGLDALKASRTFKEDGLMTHMNGIRPRADLAGAIAHIAGQQWSAIYTRP
jgi:hypothetical protein